MTIRLRSSRLPTRNGVNSFACAIESPSLKRWRAPRRLSHVRYLAEGVREFQHSRFSPFRAEKFQADRHANRRIRRWRREPAWEGERRKSGAVRQHTVSLRLILADRHDQSTLVRIEQRIESVLDDRR